MTRFTASAVIAILVFMGFCCPPPALALEKPEPKVCPLTQQKCETSEAECDPPPPQLATALELPAATAPEVVSLPAAPTLPSPPISVPAVSAYLSTPTRTIVLRI